MTSRKARSPAKLIAGLAALLLCGMGAALVVVMGPEGDAVEAAPEVADVEQGSQPDESAPEETGGGTGRRQVATTGGADEDVAATLRGRVREYRSRKPVVGLSLTLVMPPENADGEPTKLVSESDSEGVFRFTALPPRGGYELSGVREPFAPVAMSGIELAPTEDHDLGTIWLDVPVDLPVQVTGMDGTPVVGAHVAVYATSGGAAAEAGASTTVSRIAGLAATPTPTAVATTNDGGDAVVAGLLPGRYHVRATAEGRGPASKGGVLLAPDAAVRPLRLLLPRAHELTGTVVDADEKPVTEATVIATPNGSRRAVADKLEGETTEKGTYTITGLGPGLYTLYIARADKPLVRVGTARIPDQERVDLRLAPTATLLGVITSEGGEPIVDAEVSYAPQGGAAMVTRTGEDGAYLLEDVPSGASQYFRVRADGFIPYPDPTAPQQGTGESVREGAEIRRDIALTPGMRVGITVTAKGENRPIEGAKVELRMAQMWGSGGQPWRATTNDEGVAEFPGISPGTYLVAITADGYVQEEMPPHPQNLLQSAQALPPAWRLSVTEDTTASYVLARGSTVTGIVKDPDGNPFAGARVTVTGAKGQTPIFSDEEGRFTVDAVPPVRRATASASAPGFTRKSSEPFAVPEGETVKDIEIELAKGGTIRGRLRSSEGTPLEGAYVRYAPGRLQGRNSWSFRQFDRQEKHPVAPDGSFEIKGVTAGAVTVRGDADGHLPAWDSDVTVTAGQDTGGVDVILSPGAEMTGRVEGPGGEPVSGVELTANYTGTSQQRQWGFVAALPGAPTTQSDAEGRFVFRGLKQGNYNVSAGKNGFAPGWSQAATGTGEIVIKLGAAESISGVVKGPDGKPLAGVPVQARNADNSRGRNNYWWGGNRVFTAPDGSFEFINLREGAYDLTVSANWIWGRDINVKDKVEQGVRSGRDDVEILVEAGTTIEGRVLDQDDNPITVGWISARSESGNSRNRGWGGGQRWTRLGSDGTFKISGLEPGAHTVHASGSFVSDASKGVSTGTTDLEIRVRAGFLISGWLVDMEGLSITRGFNLQIRKKGTEQWNWTSVHQPGDGEFVITGLEDGAYDLKIQASPFAPVERTDVVVGTDDLEIVLQQGKTIEGVIVDSGGNPISGNIQATQINLTAGQTATNGWGRGNAEGVFKIDGLVDGEYRLYVRGNNLAPSIVEPVRSGSSGLRIVMDVGVSVTGTVKYQNGDPIPNARLRLRDDVGLQVAYTRTQQDGTFTFNNVPDGGDWKLVGSIPISGPDIEFEHDAKVASGATDIAVVVE